MWTQYFLCIFFFLQGIVEFGSRHEQEDAIDKLDDAEF